MKIASLSIGSIHSSVWLQILSLPLAFIKISFYHFQQLLLEDIMILYQAHAFYCVVGKIIACKIC